MAGRRYLTILAARKREVAVTVVLVVLGVLAVSRIMGTSYDSTATVRVSPQAGEAVGYDLNTYLDRLQNTYAKLATGKPLVDRLVANLRLEEAPAIEVEPRPNTELLQIRVRADSPDVAARAANELASLLIARAREINDEGAAAADAAFRLSLVETALAPQDPSGPNLQLALALALVLGLLGGTGIAFLLENLRPKVYDSNEIGELTATRVLGAVPKERRSHAEPLFNSGSPGEEAFHRLRAHVLALASAPPEDGMHSKAVGRPPGGARRLLVTSAERNEGKSTVVANLGVSIAEIGRTVVLVDADLRLPTLHATFGLSNELGLSSVLTGDVPLNAAVQRTSDPGLRVLTSGPPVEHPADLLATPELAEVLGQLTTGVDVVLVDSPALLGPADALTLARTIGNVLLVVRRTRTARDAVLEARSQLTELGVRIVGVVVNDAEAPTDRPFYGPRKFPPAGVER